MLLMNSNNFSFLVQPLYPGSYTHSRKATQFYGIGNMTNSYGPQSSLEMVSRIAWEILTVFLVHSYFYLLLFIIIYYYLLLKISYF